MTTDSTELSQLPPQLETSAGRGAAPMSAAARWIFPAAFAALLVLMTLRHPFMQGDTGWVLQAIYIIRGHLEHRSYFGQTYIAPFPLFQHLTGLAFSYAGLGPDGLALAFAICSCASYFGLFIITFLTLRRFAGAWLGWFGCLVLLLSELVAFAPTTFNELPAALLTLAFTANVLVRGHKLITGLLFVLAAITKDIAWPFLLAMWFVAILARPENRQRTYFIAQGIVAAVLTAMAGALNGAFNFYRYGVIWNAVYVEPSRVVHQPLKQLELFASLWISPNGGLLEFWPAAVAILGLLFVAVCRHRRKGALGEQRQGARLRLASALLAMTVLGFFYGMSCWYAPFGWVCWGSRLVLPWLPSFLLLVLYLHSDAIAVMVSALARHKIAAITLIVLLTLLSLPHLLFLYDRGEIVQFFGVDDAAIRTMNPFYYAKLADLTWHQRPMMLDVWHALASPLPLLHALCFAGTALVLAHATGATADGRFAGRRPAPRPAHAAPPSHESST